MIEFALAILLSAQLLGWLVLMVTLYHLPVFRGKRLRLALMMSAMGLLVISCLAGLGGLIDGQVMFYLPTFLGRLGGACLPWSVILLHAGMFADKMIGDTWVERLLRIFEKRMW